jgi:hypothetical protein
MALKADCFVAAPLISTPHSRPSHVEELRLAFNDPTYLEGI